VQVAASVEALETARHGTRVGQVLSDAVITQVIGHRDPTYAKSAQMGHPPLWCTRATRPTLEWEWSLGHVPDVIRSYELRFRQPRASPRRYPMYAI
jgi:hypothetical protein